MGVKSNAEYAALRRCPARGVSCHPHSDTPPSRGSTCSGVLQQICPTSTMLAVLGWGTQGATGCRVRMLPGDPPCQGGKKSGQLAGGPAPAWAPEWTGGSSSGARPACAPPQFFPPQTPSQLSLRLPAPSITPPRLVRPQLSMGRGPGLPRARALLSPPLVVPRPWPLAHPGQSCSLPSPCFLLRALPLHLLPQPSAPLPGRTSWLCDV